MKVKKILIFSLLALLVAYPVYAGDTEQEEGEEDYALDEEETPDAAAGEPDEKDVVVLTVKNFDLVKKAPYALVEFYAPWCGHCKTLKPKYALAATQIKKYNPDIVVGKVDATVEADLAKEHEVQGYPTLKWFVNGKVAEYQGGRETNEIVQWVKKKTGPAITAITKEEQLSEFEKDNEVIVVGFFDKLTGSDFKALEKVAQAEDGAEFLSTSSAVIAKKAGITSKAPAISIVTNFENEGRQTLPFDGALKQDAIEKFVNKEKTPLIIPFNQKNQQKIFGGTIQKQLIIVASKDVIYGDSDKAKVIKKAAAKFKEDLIFVSCDKDDENIKPVLQFFDIPETSETPVVAGFSVKTTKKYKMKGEFSEKNFMEFAKGHAEDTLTPDYKSEPVPEKDIDENGVKIVVGKSIDTVVMDPKKDVMLYVYAPWCGHCQQFNAVYNKVAKKFQSIESVVIAKMDGTTNEHADVQVDGFPTLMFCPAEENKKCMPYGGDRSFKDVVKFIKKNAKVKFELPSSKKAKDKEAKDEL